jgi:hypothetical protein
MKESPQEGRSKAAAPSKVSLGAGLNDGMRNVAAPHLHPLPLNGRGAMRYESPRGLVPQGLFLALADSNNRPSDS